MFTADTWASVTCECSQVLLKRADLMMLVPVIKFKLHFADEYCRLNVIFRERVWDVRYYSVTYVEIVAFHMQVVNVFVIRKHNMTWADAQVCPHQNTVLTNVTNNERILDNQTITIESLIYLRQMSSIDLIGRTFSAFNALARSALRSALFSAVIACFLVRSETARCWYCKAVVFKS
jgi:hypothetical protein